MEKVEHEVRDWRAVTAYDGKNVARWVVFNVFMPEDIEQARRLITHEKEVGNVDIERDVLDLEFEQDPDNGKFSISVTVLRPFKTEEHIIYTLAEKALSYEFIDNHLIKLLLIDMDYEDWENFIKQQDEDVVGYLHKYRHLCVSMDTETVFLVSEKMLEYAEGKKS